MQDPAPGLTPLRLLEFLEQARAGSKEAKDEIFAAYLPGMLTVARARIAKELKAKASCSDLLQETFVAAFEDFSEFEGKTDDELRAWLYGIMIHKLEDLKRRWHAGRRDIRREVPLHPGAASDRLMADTPQPDAAAMEDEEAETVQRAVNRLSPDHALVLRLRLSEGLSFSEIGGSMGCTEEAARSRFRRAWERLFVELGFTGEIPPPP